MTRKVMVVTHGGRSEAIAAAAEAVSELQRAGFEVIRPNDESIPPSYQDPVGLAAHHSVGLLDGIEAVVVLGGDGTILRAAELTRGTTVPLLGINLGHVGFLAEAERETLQDSVRRLAERNYAIEARGVLDVSISRPGQDQPLTDWALNEATVEKANRQRMIEVNLAIDGRPLESFGCDGVVLSTATGSTAHAFSAGGPVIWPDVDALLVVPLAAHALFSRPLVVGPHSTISVLVAATGATDAVVTMDGRRQVVVSQGTQIDIRRGQHPVYLARLSAAPFADRLVNKFDLPVRGWRDPR